MRIRRGAAVPGITIRSIGVPLATAGPALAVVPPPTQPAVTGVITGPRSFVPNTGEVIVVSETLLPNAPAYQASVLVTRHVPAAEPERQGDHVHRGTPVP